MNPLKFLEVLLLFSAIFPRSTQGLYFFLTEGAEKCFQEDLPPGSDINGNIVLVDPLIGVDPYDKSQGVILRVVDPKEITIRNLVFQERTRFMFTAEKMGKYLICLQTTSSGHWIRENKKYRFEIKIHVGEDVNVMSKIAKKGDIYGMSEGFRLLNNEIENFLMRHEIISAKDERLFHDNLESDSKVVFLTIVEAFVLLALGIYQVLALRRFFIVKNLY